MAVSPVGSANIPLSLPVSMDGGVRLDAPLGPSKSGGFSPPAAIGEQQGVSPFEQLLVDSLNKTNEKLVVAEQAAADFASGKSDDIHGTMIAVTEADIQLRLVGSMRNRIVDAFNEIWRMQV